MRIAALLCLAAVALAACDRDGAKKEADPNALSGPTFSGRAYTCDLSYIAVRGPLVSESKAQVRMLVDTGPVTPGWKVENVDVRTPLPDAGGFDPWLAFMPGVQRQFVEQRDGVLTLATSEGSPVTLNTVSGDLNWSKAGALGETEYTGGCY